MQNKKGLLIKNTANLFNTTIVMLILISVLFSLTVNIISSATNVELGVITSSKAYILLSYTSTTFALIFTLLVYSKNVNIPFKELFKCEKPTKKSIIATLLITFGMLFGLSNVNNIIYEFFTGLGLNLSSPTLPEFSIVNFIVILIFVCITPPILEEIIFRNILFKNFSSFGSVLAILISSLTFSLYHMSLSQTAYQFIVGVLFSLILLSGGNYLLTAISHFINNLFVVLNYYFFNITFSNELNIIFTVLALISLVVGVTLLLINNKNYVKYQQKSAGKILLSSVLGISICVLFWVVGLFQ